MLLSGAVEKLWLLLPQLFDPVQNFFNGNYYDVLTEKLKEYPQARMLDLGCGVGSMLQIFNPKVYVGVDINPTFIKLASRKYEKRQKTTFVCEDALTFVPKEKFDLVIASSFIHHLSDNQLKQMLTHVRNKIDFKYLVINDGKPKETMWKPLLLWLDGGANFRDVEVVEPFLKEGYEVVEKGKLSANRPWYYYPYLVAKKKKRS